MKASDTYADLSQIAFKEGFSLLAESDQPPRGVALLIHGLSGTPSEMEVLARFLHHKGFTAIVPRLAGHGVNINELKVVPAERWLQDMEQAFDEATKINGSPPFIIGQSFGALLALYLSVKRPTEVSGIISISASWRFRARFEASLLYLLSFFPDQILDTLGVRIKTRRRKNYLALPRNAFPQHSIGAGARLVGIRRMVEKGLRNVSCPVLILQDPFDHHVAFNATELIAAGISSEVVKIEYFPGGEHELLLGHRHEEVMETVYQFMERVLASRERHKPKRK